MSRYLKSFIALTVSSVFLFVACSTTENTTSDSQFEDDLNENTEESNVDDSGLMILKLSDSYGANDNAVPDVYKQIKKKTEIERDLTRGFRVQIYSGENVVFADSIASSFRAWSDTTVVGYQAETYTFFKAPHYRVHVGDFHNKERALTYSKIVKRLYKDAWVVYDTVEPFRVPADTIRIKIADS